MMLSKVGDFNTFRGFAGSKHLGLKMLKWGQFSRMWSVDSWLQLHTTQVGGTVPRNKYSCRNLWNLFIYLLFILWTIKKDQIPKWVRIKKHIFENKIHHHKKSLRTTKPLGFLLESKQVIMMNWKIKGGLHLKFSISWKCEF